MERNRGRPRMSAAADGRQHAPAAARNREPIAAVLREWLPESGLVLEVASGTGEHAVHFARCFPELEWQPSDPSSAALASILAWQRAEGLANLRQPIAFDACDLPWPVARADALLCINMVHISPWEASLALIEGATQVLSDSAPLILYGPWIVEGISTAPSNLAFDVDLRARNPSWGLRRVSDFAAAAEQRGLLLVGERLMPANNMMLQFRRR